jgi:hypothetical protein
MGYAAFVEALEREQVARRFQRLGEDIAVTARDHQGHDARLRLIQRRLVDIVDVLDPDSLRVPSHLRQRVAESRLRLIRVTAGISSPLCDIL